jgi:hypothetical protein
MPGTPPVRGYGTHLKRKCKMKAINNLVQATKNTIGAVINTASIGTQLLADGTGLLNSGVSEFKPVAKSLLLLPFSATEGYLVEEGMDVEQAQQVAYKYVKQPLSLTITAVGVGSGALLADLLKEDNLEVAVVDKKEVAVKA